MKPESNLPHAPWTPYALLGILWILVSFLVVPTWGWTYWDFGDGNYMYIARRVREGLTLYKDILAPQPPLHTYSGVAVQAIGGAVAGSELVAIRIFCLFNRFMASLLVFLIARKLFACPLQGIIAAAVYLFLPIGFWWSLGYQSENLENVFLLLAILLLMRWDWRWCLLAGLSSALAMQCNMTALPFFMANALFLAFRKVKLLPWYAGSTIVVYLLTTIAANVVTDGYYVNNVLLNQVGTFPRTDILSSSPGFPDTFFEYAIFTKIIPQTMEVLRLEAGFIILAATGVVMAVRLFDMRADLNESKKTEGWLRVEFMSWMLIAGLLSICFTAKGGTVNYIFVLGEPYVAIFAGSAIVKLLRVALPKSWQEWRQLSIFYTAPFLKLTFTAVPFVIILIPACNNIRMTLNEVQTELPEDRVLEIKNFIETYAEPGEEILAPPFYAYLTGTNVTGELAENYIWNIKFMNEQFDAQNYGRETGEATAKMQEIASSIRSQKPKVVLLDTAQTGKVQIIREALDEHYQHAEVNPIIHTRNTQLELFIPKSVNPHHLPLNAAGL